MKENRTCWGLLRRRQCLVPTWRGGVLLLLVLALLLLLAGRYMHPFLAVTDSIPGGVLVVEGWVPDNAFEAARQEFKRNHYEKLFVTGGPIDHGERLAEYKTQAECGAAILIKSGLSSNLVQAIPSPLVKQDRTFTEAVTLKKWLRDNSQSVTKVNLITEGPHARRSRLLFEKALGKDVQVGVISVPMLSYDPERWWRSSPGVRIMIGEALAYGYARFIFRAPRDP